MVSTARSRRERKSAFSPSAERRCSSGARVHAQPNVIEAQPRHERNVGCIRKAIGTRGRVVVNLCEPQRDVDSVLKVRARAKAVLRAEARSCAKAGKARKSRTIKQRKQNAQRLLLRPGKNPQPPYHNTSSGLILHSLPAGRHGRQLIFCHAAVRRSRMAKVTLVFAICWLPWALAVMSTPVACTHGADSMWIGLALGLFGFLPSAAMSGGAKCSCTST